MFHIYQSLSLWRAFWFPSAHLCCWYEKNLFEKHKIIIPHKPYSYPFYHISTWKLINCECVEDFCLIFNDWNWKWTQMDQQPKLTRSHWWWCYCIVECKMFQRAYKCESKIFFLVISKVWIKRNWRMTSFSATQKTSEFERNDNKMTLKIVLSVIYSELCPLSTQHIFLPEFLLPRFLYTLQNCDVAIFPFYAQREIFDSRMKTIFFLVDKIFFVLKT